RAQRNLLFGDQDRCRHQLLESLVDGDEFKVVVEHFDPPSMRSVTENRGARSIDRYQWRTTELSRCCRVISLTQEVAMDSSRMQELVNSHMQAENDGDIDAAVAVYTDDVEHDVVGFPDGVSRGKDGARDFYAYLTANFRSEGWDVVRRFCAPDSMIIEQLMTGTVVGSLLGLPGNGRRIRFR